MYVCCECKDNMSYCLCHWIGTLGIYLVVNLVKLQNHIRVQVTLNVTYSSLKTMLN